MGLDKFPHRGGIYPQLGGGSLPSGYAEPPNDYGA